MRVMQVPGFDEKDKFAWLIDTSRSAAFLKILVLTLLQQRNASLGQTFM